jgi:hypothetical protein
MNITFGKTQAWGYFKELDDSRMAFKSANEFKSSMLLLGITFLGLITLAELQGIFIDGEAVILSVFEKSEHRATAFAMLSIPLFFFILWLIAPPIRVHFDRSTRAIHYKRGRDAFVIPWGQANVAHQWIPTKTGGSTLFTLLVTPPFPDILQRLVEKKQRPAPGEGYVFRLGSFDVQSPEHGQAIFQFLDTWMHSRDPAASLYDSMVRSRFGG